MDRIIYIFALAGITINLFFESNAGWYFFIAWALLRIGWELMEIKEKLL